MYWILTIRSNGPLGKAFTSVLTVAHIAAELLRASVCCDSCTIVPGQAPPHSGQHSVLANGVRDIRRAMGIVAQLLDNCCANVLAHLHNIVKQLCHDSRASANVSNTIGQHRMLS